MIAIRVVTHNDTNLEEAIVKRLQDVLAEYRHQARWGLVVINETSEMVDDLLSAIKRP